MNKEIKTLIFLVFSILLVYSSAFADEIGKFTIVEGRVDIVKPGQIEALPVAVGDTVSNSDSIRTKSLSKAEIKFADNTVLRLAENTKVEIQEYLIDKDGIRNTATINVERGKIRTIVSKTKGPTNFFVNTPNTQGSVRGSDIFLFYQKSTTGVLVKEGSLATFNNTYPDKVVEVPKGNTLVILPDSPPQNPRPYLEPEIKRYETDTTPVAREVKEDPTQIKGTVSSVIGDVRIRTKGTISWHPARLNEVVWAGDEIQTGENGKIEIRLDNDNVINLKPNSRIYLRALSRNLKTGEYENLLDSNIGKIRATVKKIEGNSKFEIKTPTAVAAVRGTTTYLNILPNLTTAYFEGGSGMLTNIISGITQVVGDGQNSSSDNQGNVSDPQDTSDEQESENEGGWEAEAGEDEYGYTPPGGGGGEDFEDMPETEGEEPTGAPEGYQDNSVNVPFEPTTTSAGPSFSGLSGNLTGNFGYFGSFEIYENSSISGTLTSEGTFLSTASDLEILPTATISGTYLKPNSGTLWFGDISGTDTQGGTFLGWMGGTWQSWEGLLAGLFIDSSGTAGVIGGYLSGTNDDTTGLFSGDGALAIAPVVKTDLLPSDLDSSTVLDSSYGYIDRTFDYENEGYISVEYSRNYLRILGQPWGILEGIYAGEYYNPEQISEWSDITGGSLENGGYFLSAILGEDDNGSLIISLFDAYIDYENLGMFSETILGIYSDGDFEGLGLGTFVEGPLTFSGKWGKEQTSLYYNDDGYIDIGGAEFGLIGSTTPNWWDEDSLVDGSFQFLAMGKYYYSEGISESDPKIWNTPIYSYNDSTGYNTTLDGGAFKGFTAGIWNNQIMDGAVAAIYMDPDGNAGILRGDLSGIYSSDLSMWMAMGELTPTLMETGLEILPEDFYIESDPIENWGLYGDFKGTGEIQGWQDYGYSYNIEGYDTWGIFDIKLGNGNYYENPDSVNNTTWSAVMGGAEDNEFGVSYWLTNIEGSWEDNEIRGTITGHILSYENLGTIEGDLFGVYDESEGVGEGYWIASAIGSWYEEELTSSGELYNTIEYFGDYNGYFYGLIGVTGPIWGDGTTSNFVSIGEFSSYGNEPFIWYSGGDSLYSYHYDEGTNTTYDGGAFYGITGGVGSNGELEGLAIALYIDPNGNAGILSGEINGPYSDDLGMYLLNGTLTNNSMAQAADVGILAQDFIYNNLEEGDFYGPGIGSFSGLGNLEINLEGVALNITGQSWGIWGIKGYGSYTEPLTPPTSWKLTFVNYAVSDTGYTDTFIFGAINGTEWSNGRLKGQVNGVWLSPTQDTNRVDAGTMSGKVIGNYIDVDVGTDTWQAVGAGEWVEVTELIPPVDNMDDLNSMLVSVPITETYTNLLTGPGSFAAGGTLIGSMDISIFDGAIWAALISGTYSGDTGDSWTLNLVNGSDSTVLTGDLWYNNNWHASVTGTINGSDITGEAAGTFADGNFSGAGAGTVVTSTE